MPARAPSLQRDADGTAPIESYAALGDGRSVALVAADGSIDWWCVPTMDAPPLFDRLLDARDGGRFAITPVGATDVQRRYRDDSNVLETTVRTASGSARLTESLNSGEAGRLPWSELARRLEGLDGEVEFEICFRPGTRAGTSTPWMSDTPNGRVFHIGPVMALLRHSQALTVFDYDDRGVHARLRLHAGQRELLAVLATQDEALPVPPLEDIDERIERSDREWREWTGNLHYDGNYPQAVLRSALALKFLWYSPTGAIAAAATTSLPEGIGGNGNWDYRYAWVRDAAYTTKAFLRVGALPDAKAAFAWLLGTIAKHRPWIRPCYTLHGDLVPDEREIDIAGYRHTRPVRVGNTATDQLQLCLYGDVFEMTARFVDHGHILDPHTAQQLFELGNECAEAWMRKDAGFWELEDAQHYTMSKVECWMALRRASELAEAGHLSKAMLPRWQREQARILDWIDAHCWSEDKQAYTLYAGSDALDAGLMLASRFGLGEVRRERMLATREAIRRELGGGGEARTLLHRYSGMQEREGAFIACSFWMVEAYGLLDERDEARRLFEHLLDTVGNDVGLLPELVDPHSGAALGNMPQGLSHLALIHAALAVGGE
ncbi:glycoside hydrolase family 15 protein [Xanthomonas sp. NCPPB 2654]|uniref:glycoside hydrolase family 15 protein n=1 Tax=unclassified Xanthomonas TaxID=2643310 RepID=UPI0021DFD167|nr:MULTISPECIES: glycoside hydrolase family 15 protein [unclassified Xanthomonas]MDL5364612.1 glycoside hydrolase family 15 protein [Xanthomonas sp. NCPPB 2654]UYC22824.1 glycoside hydrolase family 15 protein [Xanthomonas sp. CFBP 8443]